MTDLIVSDVVSLRDLREVNLIVGRNGSGKSRFLRALASGMRQNQEYNAYLINPERSGIFKQDPNTENNMYANPAWMIAERGKNQPTNFKQTSASRLKETRTLFYQKLETDWILRSNPDVTFENEYLRDINKMLFNVQISSGSRDFSFTTIEGTNLPPDGLSSGESEVISLASEILYFFETLAKDKTNILLLDEPDVHLHPDLQVRLVRFLERRLVKAKSQQESQIHVIIASHSSALLGALSESPDAGLAVKHTNIDLLIVKPTTQVLKKTAPFFAHPLSSIFNLEHHPSSLNR